MFDAALHAAGIDVEHAIEASRYITFDAAELLESFMVDGAPDAKRFKQAIGGELTRAGSGSRRVRVYGEMVASLWRPATRTPRSPWRSSGTNSRTRMSSRCCAPIR